jgi:hypothetical protein
MNKRLCIQCKQELTTRFQKKYCSNQCQKEHEYHLYIREWKLGRKHGNIGITAKNISGHLKRYLFEKYGEKCALCKWSKKHPKTGNVPLEIDHIDGNSENNIEKNLKLLCPNCHALTPYFKNYNIGKGRKWRKEKYIRNSK